ncbi:MAG: histidine phosphatase family protein [Hyphomicrobium sp.]|nr:histidine phosphatase family protein [Hyphomicrobium sp.]
MLTLLLLRHAKSSWDDPSLDDIDRPLSKRGAKTAPMMGAFIAREKLKPDLVLCSTAVRTRGTLALVLPELGQPPPDVVFEETLYLASTSDMLARVRTIEKPRKRVLVVGHNPGTHALALTLIGDGARANIAALATKFPTAGLAVLTFQSDKWSDVRPASGHLDVFVTPRGLA